MGSWLDLQLGAEGEDPITVEDGVISIQDATENDRGAMTAADKVRLRELAQFQGALTTRVAVTDNIADLSSVPAMQDGATVLEGQQILLAGQTDRVENGFYTLTNVNAGVGELVRSINFTSTITRGLQIHVSDGDINRGSWVNVSDDEIVGISELRFIKKDAELDVRLFGAIGDGTTDDTVAIQSAIDAAASALTAPVVHFPPGRYKTTSTLMLNKAVTLRGVALPAGGINAIASSASCILCTHAGDCIYFDGADVVSGTEGSGGGVQNLRIVQNYGTPGVAYGSGIVITGVDVSHRSSWTKIRETVIEESGQGAWGYAVEVDGTPCGGILDLYMSDVSTHTSSPGKGMLLKKAVGPLVYDCTFYINGVVEVTGTSGGGNTTSAGQFSNVSGLTLALDWASDFSMNGGIWTNITETANTSGNCTLLPGRVDAGYTVTSTRAVGLMRYHAEANSGIAGAFKFSRALSVGAPASHTGLADGDIALANQKHILFCNDAGTSLLSAVQGEPTNLLGVGLGFDAIKLYGGAVENLRTDTTGVKLNRLTASRVLALDGSKYVTTLTYDQASTASALVQRDSNAKIFTRGVTVDDGSGNTGAMTYNNAGLTFVTGSFRFDKAPALTNGQYLVGITSGGGGVAAIGVDANDALRLDVLGGATKGVAIGAVAGFTNAAANDLTLCRSAAIRTAAAGNTLRLLHTDGSDLLHLGIDIASTTIYGNGNSRIKVDNTGIGFNGATPVARPDYTVTNHSDDRALNETGDTLAQVANVLGTLINDLITYGILQ